MGFFRKVSPTGAVRDFAAVWSANPYRWPVLAAAMGATLGLMVIIIPKSEIVPPEQPEVTYITNFEPGRSDEEIMRSNIENQKKQDELRKLEAQQEEVRKGLYRELGKATGVDTDKMEREIAKDEAADKAAREKARKEADAAWKAQHPDQH